MNNNKSNDRNIHRCSYGCNGNKGSSRPEAPPRSKSAKSREGFPYHCFAILILIPGQKKIWYQTTTFQKVDGKW